MLTENYLHDLIDNLELSVFFAELRKNASQFPEYQTFEEVFMYDYTTYRGVEQCNFRQSLKAFVSKCLASSPANTHTQKQMAHNIFNIGHIETANFNTDDSTQRIKAQIGEQGKPLKEWDIEVYRGVVTAFIIDKATKNDLIRQDSKSAEIIKPLLRGRDIKKYSYEFANLYLICTFPALKLDIEDYPAIKNTCFLLGRQDSNSQASKVQEKKQGINGLKLKTK